MESDLRVCGILLAVVLVAAVIPADGMALPENPFRGDPVSPQDIDVTYIAQSPRYDYDAVKNVPAPGDPVNFTAHVRNRGTAETGAFTCTWYLDGNAVADITMPPIPAGREVTIDYPWTWESGDHEVTFFADPENALSEKSEQNNLRTIRTTGLRVGFWVEASVVRYFETHQYAFTRNYGIPDEANSWEDWAQRQVAFANRIFSEARYPSTPDGVLDRWRIDQVIIVADGKLPLSGWLPGNTPDVRDRSVDLMWGYDEPILRTGFYSLQDPKGAFFQEPSLIHELLHARYLVDSYALDVTGGQTGLLDAKGARLFANSNAMIHANSQAPSMMGGCSPVMGEWEAAALNLWAGRRPRAGWANYNSHAGLGWYLERRMPARNLLRVRDQDGKPLAGATVQVFQAGPWPNGGNPLYGKYIDNTADRTGTTDAEGLFALGSNPFSVAEPIGEWDFPKCIDFIQVDYRGQTRYAWLDIAEVQVQQFRGVTDAVYDITVEVDPETNLAPLVDAGEDRVVYLPDPVPLDGSASDDGRPEPPGRVTVTWSRVSGPGTVTFGSATSARTTVRFSTAGTYVLRLAASDGTLVAQDEVTLRVFPHGNGNGEVLTTDRVTTPVYLGRSSTNLQQGQSFLPAGPLLSRVSVALAKRGNPAPDITVRIRSTLKGPDLATAVIPGDAITSTDGMAPDWVTAVFPDPVSMAPGTSYFLLLSVPGSSTSHHYLVATNTGNPYPGGFFFKDTPGTVSYGTDMVARFAFGDGVNEPPGKAEVTGGPGSCGTAIPCTYRAVATDPDGDLLRYTFDWGDGQTTDTVTVASGTAAQAGHAWSAAGSYAARARAVDGAGLAGAWSEPLAVTVSGAPNTAPAAGDPTGPSGGTAGQDLTFTASAADPDGDTVRLQWDWGDGSTGDSPLQAAGTAVAGVHAWQAAGTYPVKVRAVDEHDAASPWSGALEVRIDPAREVVVTLAATPSGSWNLGSAATRRKEAQSFIAEGTALDAVRLGFARVRSPTGLIRISIRDSLYGAPLAETDVGAGWIDSTDYRNPTWFTLTFPSAPRLAPGSTYYLVLETDRISQVNYYRVGYATGNPYPGGAFYPDGTTANGDADIVANLTFSG